MAKKRRDDEQEDSLQDLIDALADVVGPVTAAVIEAHAAGSGASIVAGATGGVLSAGMRRGFKAIDQRLGLRRRRRMEQGLIDASRSLRARLALGAERRTDGFFEKDESGDSDASRLIEGVLYRIVTEYENLKAPYIANIYAATAVSDVLPANAHLVLKYAGDLTYRGVVCLALIGQPHERQLSDRPLPEPLSPATQGVLAEIMRLEGLELISQRGDKGWAYPITATANLVPARLQLHGLGVTMYQLMGLSAVPLSMVETVAQYLRIGPATTDAAASGQEKPAEQTNAEGNAPSDSAAGKGSRDDGP